jgi:hypothetical protein
MIARLRKLGAFYLYGLAMFTIGASLGAAEAFGILATLWGPCL